MNEEQNTVDTVSAEDLVKKIAYLETELKQAIEKRQNVKSEAEVLKLKLEEIERTKLEEQQKYKELYEKTSSELETYKPYAEKVKEYESKFAEIQEQRKTEILNKLPENLRASFSKLENIELLSEQVNAIIETMPHKVGVDTSKASKGSFDYSNITSLSQIKTVEQLEELKQKNPQKYNELLKKR